METFTSPHHANSLNIGDFDDDISICSYDIPYLSSNSQDSPFTEFIKSHSDKLLLSSTHSSLPKGNLPRTTSMRLTKGLKPPVLTQYKLKRSQTLWANFSHYDNRDESDDEDEDDNGLREWQHESKHAVKDEENIEVEKQVNESASSESSGVDFNVSIIAIQYRDYD